MLFSYGLLRFSRSDWCEASSCRAPHALTERVQTTGGWRWQCSRCYRTFEVTYA